MDRQIMPGTAAGPPVLKLSICIPTLNRAGFVGATLDSILPQLTEDCELVLLDGASKDDTERVVTERARASDRLRYVRQDADAGVDRAYDRVVELARGEYCWLMTDDDLLKPGAVAAVLAALDQDFSLVIVNTEAKDFGMTQVLQPRWLQMETDRIYAPGRKEMDRLVADTAATLRFIGSMVVKRAIWLARDRQRYFGSLFIHLGVILQQPLPTPALVIAQPLVSYRMGNVHTFSPRMFETFMVNLPTLIWSLGLSEQAKRKVCAAEPWRDPLELLRWRGLGRYSLADYRRWICPRLRGGRRSLMPRVIAMLPGTLAHVFLAMYFRLARGPYQGMWQRELMLQTLQESRFHLRNWRGFRRWSRAAGRPA